MQMQIHDAQRTNKNFIGAVSARDSQCIQYTLKCGADVHFEYDRAL